MPLPPLLPSFVVVPRPRQRYDGIRRDDGDPCRLVLLCPLLVEEDDRRDALLSREHRVPTVAVDTNGGGRTAALLVVEGGDIPREVLLLHHNDPCVTPETAFLVLDT